MVDPNALLLTSVKLEITSTFVTSRVTTLVSISAPLVAVIVKVWVWAVSKSKPLTISICPLLFSENLLSGSWRVKVVSLNVELMVPSLPRADSLNKIFPVEGLVDWIIASFKLKTKLRSKFEISMLKVWICGASPGTDAWIVKLWFELDSKSKRSFNVTCPVTGLIANFASLSWVRE